MTFAPATLGNVQCGLSFMTQGNGGVRKGNFASDPQYLPNGTPYVWVVYEGDGAQQTLRLATDMGIDVGDGVPRTVRTFVTSSPLVSRLPVAA